MQEIIQEALKNSDKEKLLRENSQVEQICDEFGQPQIVIVGCGGAGNNTVNRLYNIGVSGAETIAINTDKQHLEMVQADKKILVGKSLTRGLGAGGYPEVGRRAAELARGTLEEVLCDADLVFITAGMGGGTGTGTAPVVADIAKQNDAIVVGMVSSPFRVERARAIKAEEGLEELRSAADTVIVLDNNRLLDYVPNLPIEQAFSVMDQLIAETVKGISETITQPSLINLDYADVRTIMGCGGVAVMLVGEARNQDRGDAVVRSALNHPLLDVDYMGATGCLVHITGGPDLTLLEAEKVAHELTYELDSHANVIWGARINKEYEGRVRVMAIMTGVQSAQILGPQSYGEPQGQKNDVIEIREVERNSNSIIDVIPMH
ncbi:MAG: Cell division protein FtsZ 1 [ANME-2 cluster archaeon HR1]|jgi:cell division protein FtsZ|nr:MAG: cell division protein FtsZ [ANME-2 cluster archaeon]PPA80501.1 MAG: Cell division protein FtsZ 1 [ANME-2 cluster archaeon HR1]